MLKRISDPATDADESLLISGNVELMLNGEDFATPDNVFDIQARALTGTMGPRIATSIHLSSLGVVRYEVPTMVQTAANSQRLAADLARLDDVFNYPLYWCHLPPKQQTERSVPS